MGVGSGMSELGAAGVAEAEQQARAGVPVRAKERRSIDRAKDRSVVVAAVSYSIAELGANLRFAIQLLLSFGGGLSNTFRNAQSIKLHPVSRTINPIQSALRHPAGPRRPLHLLEHRRVHRADGGIEGRLPGHGPVLFI